MGCCGIKHAGTPQREMRGLGYALLDLPGGSPLHRRRAWFTLAELEFARGRYPAEMWLYDRALALFGTWIDITSGCTGPSWPSPRSPAR